MKRMAIISLMFAVTLFGAASNHTEDEKQQALSILHVAARTLKDIEHKPLSDGIQEFRHMTGLCDATVPACISFDIAPCTFNDRNIIVNGQSFTVQPLLEGVNIHQLRSEYPKHMQLVHAVVERVLRGMCDVPQSEHFGIFVFDAIARYFQCRHYDPVPYNY